MSREELIKAGLATIKQDYSPEACFMASQREFVEDAIQQLVDSGWQPPQRGQAVTSGQYPSDAEIKSAAFKAEIGLTPFCISLGKLAEIVYWACDWAAAQQREALHLPDDGAYIIRYDDTDRADEFFAMTGARDGALARYRQISGNWNAHLYVKIDSNSRDVECPSASTHPIAQPATDLRVVAVVEESSLDGDVFAARVRWIHNPVPAGAELWWDHAQADHSVEGAPQLKCSVCRDTGWLTEFENGECTLNMPCLSCDHAGPGAKDAGRPDYGNLD